MLTKLFASLLTLPIIVPLCLLAQTRGQKDQPVQPSQQASTFPNLDTIKIDGKPCGLEGDPIDSEHAAMNRLRNRYHLPDQFEPQTLEDLEKLLQGEVLQGEVKNAPGSEDRNHKKAVSLVGVVTEVRVGGCGQEIIVLGRRRRVGEGSEYNMCRTNNLYYCTYQIKVVAGTNRQARDQRRTFVVKVTARARFLAKRGLLKSDIGKDWSLGQLRAKLINRRVRFNGWLFYDAGYADRAWLTDPDDKIRKDKKTNTIQTAWGIQPVMGIELITDPSSRSSRSRRHQR
jgi:hypothetical protein